MLGGVLECWKLVLEASKLNHVDPVKMMVPRCPCSTRRPRDRGAEDEPGGYLSVTRASVRTLPHWSDATPAHAVRPGESSLLPHLISQLSHYYPIPSLPSHYCPITLLNSIIITTSPPACSSLHRTARKSALLPRSSTSRASRPAPTGQWTTWYRTYTGQGLEPRGWSCWTWTSGPGCHPRRRWSV